MTDRADRGTVVLDIGSTNVKATLFDAALGVVESRALTSSWVREPYLHVDIEPVIEFANEAIEAFDKVLPVDAIVPSAHGSALALLDDTGEPVLPLMAYEAEPPDDVCRAYAALEPGFDEVFAPTNPGALTLGRQLLWQEMGFPGDFAQVKTIVPLAQYAAFRLCGEAVSEVTALGAQTHLWNPRERHFSDLARSRGWAGRFAPLVPAWQRLGPVRGLALEGRGEVLAGVHDSNANYLRYLGGEPLALLSTGTWIIAFDAGRDIAGLDAARDQVSNTTVFGSPVACCRFMGGREFELVAEGAPPEAASLAQVAGLVSAGVRSMPSFTDSGGPLPATGGMGHVEGPLPGGPVARASLASLYCAQMTAVALKALGTRDRIVVDGPFSTNATYLGLLAGLIEGIPVFASRDRNGTSVGAAMLALMDGPEVPNVPVSLAPAEPANIDGLAAYHAAWLDQAGMSSW